MHPVFSKGGTTTVGNACQVPWHIALDLPLEGAGFAGCRATTSMLPLVCPCEGAGFAGEGRQQLRVSRPA